MLLTAKLMLMRDFTLEKYKKLCLALLDSGYTPLTVYSYLVLEGKRERIISWLF
jgi:hypothetical protein